MALQRFDILVVGALRGPADAAVYAAATRFLVLGLMFVQAIQQVMTPKISECLALDDERRAEMIYRTTTVWLTLVSWPIYLMAMLYAPLLLGIFGPRLRARARPRSSSCAPRCWWRLRAARSTPMLLMGGRSMLSLFNTALALATNVGLDLLLVPEYGVTGAALGWAGGIFVNNLLPLWQVNRVSRMHPLGTGTLTAMAICLVSFGVVAGGCRLLLGDGPGVVAGGRAARGGVFVGLVQSPVRGARAWPRSARCCADVSAVAVPQQPRPGDGRDLPSGSGRQARRAMPRRAASG